MYINTLVRIKNAIARKFDKVKIPHANLDLAILEKLAKVGYITSAVKKGRGVKRIIEIVLKYDSGRPAITNMKFLSRPSHRKYVGYSDIKSSKDGIGNYILSTPKGILTDREARKQKVGGELLFEIW